jgi:hypothetical protein
MIVVYQSFVAKLWHRLSGGKYTGFVIGPLVLIVKGWNAPQIRPLLAHEAKHVEQWRRYWYVGFLPVYFYYQIRYGYWENPLEQEARAAEKYVR